MKHDPFCPDKYFKMSKTGCHYCEIISDVRKEEFSHRISASVDAAEVTYDYALEDAIEQIKSSCSQSPAMCKECATAIGAIKSLGKEYEMEDLEEYMCPFCVTPWKCNGPHIEYGDLPEFEAYIARIVKEAQEGTLKPKRRPHDVLCNIYEKTCCPHMGECECQCNCDFIQEVREDERKSIMANLKEQAKSGAFVSLDKVLFVES